MNKFIKILVVGLSFFTLAHAEAQEKKKELYINACGVVRGAFVKDLAKEFSKLTKIKVRLNKQGGDRDVVRALVSKQAQLGVGCRALLNIPGEKELKSEQVAWGILAFLVNQKNRVDNITLEQAKDILKGKIRNWKELGGADAPIHIYLRKPGVLSGVGYSLRKIVFKNLRAPIIKTEYIEPNSDAIRQAVAKDPYAFAVGDATSAQAFGKLKLLKVNGVEPTKAALASKRYKAARPYYIYLPQNATLEAKEFLAFALSKEGQAVIQKSFAASLGEAKRLLELLEESTKLENFTNENKFTLDDIIKRYRGKTLTVYSCGITRVAFSKEIIENFTKKYGIKIKYNKRGGDLEILDKLYKKEADIAIICRALFNDGEEKSLWSVQVAWGALAFIVHKSNPIENLTSKQIKGIISGKIKNWSEVGGENRPIHLVLRRLKRTGVGASMRKMLFGKSDIDLPKPYRLVKNSGEAREAVKNDPSAIAVDDVTSSQRTTGIKILNIDDVAPTKRAIIEGDYTFRRPFYATLREKPNNLSRLFIDFILSSQGQEIISKVGTANLEEGKDINSQNNLIIQKLKLELQGR